MINYTYKQSNHSLEKPTENHKNQLKLHISFLQLSRAVGKHCLLLLLFPWLTASWGCMRTQSSFPSPSAPPKSFSGSESPPPYSYNDELCQDDDLNVEIKPETITKNIPKTKQDAKKYAENALKTAKNGLKNCNMYLHSFLPILERKYVHLNEAVTHLEQYCNEIKSPIARSWCVRCIVPFKRQLRRYNAKIPSEEANLDLHLQSVKDNLEYAEGCIKDAKGLGSKKEYDELYKKKSELERQLQQVTEERKDGMNNKAMKKRKEAVLINHIKNYIRGMLFSENNLSTGANHGNANQVIIQQNNQD